MAQDETTESSSSSGSSSSAAGRLNAAAPEFTPRSAAQHHSNNPHRRGPHHQQHQHYQPRHHQGEDEGDAAAATAEDKGEGPAGHAQRGLPDDLARKVVKQVEFYFSDINLATTEHLMKFITKDPDGFVPISVVASFRKIREIVYDRSLLAAALRTSSELVVSDDGKKVGRLQPFDAEEVQSRIIVAENLPEDQKHQTLMKIFSAVGSVKSIRTCYPQDGAGPAASKTSRIEMLFANKLHAFVEYGTVEDAEKAVAEFSSGRNWRDGIRVRSLLGCLKHGLGQGRKGGDEEYAADEDGPDTTGHPQDYETGDTAQILEAHLDHQADDGFHDKGGMRQGRGRGRGGRGRGRGQYYGNSRDAHHPIGTPPSSHGEHPAVPKPPPGPRMPDGTRGFTLGRGKPLNPSNAA
ncbi:la-related protein 6B-like [Phragmites australis]|uniref:la-related protein 6B-like n=1 Tax=Phragmites australis TaxID=29695 RepID=UPI002D7735DF|nr:la-related protein 6B-like [Phragmites australis]